MMTTNVLGLEKLIRIEKVIANVMVATTGVVSRCDCYPAMKVMDVKGQLKSVVLVLVKIPRVEKEEQSEMDGRKASQKVTTFCPCGSI